MCAGWFRHPVDVTPDDPGRVITRLKAAGSQIHDVCFNASTAAILQENAAGGINADRITYSRDLPPHAQLPAPGIRFLIEEGGSWLHPTC